MIFRKVSLSNFGIYGGEYEFDLTPQSPDNFVRPVILFSGKNGVGKTTLVEAIRLCLHGPLALGSRVSQVEYKGYLYERLHQPLNNSPNARRASVGLVLDYVGVGKKTTYRIERSWRATRTENVIEKISVLENGLPIEDLDSDQLEGFLRELIPPGAAELFFFDGEKTRSLAISNDDITLFSDTFRTLLGLNLVKQLQSDLDFYISRQMASNGNLGLRGQLEKFNSQRKEIEQQRSSLQDKRHATNAAIAELQQEIMLLEQHIASEGGWFAEQRDERIIEQQRLESEIEAERRRIQELCSGLLPFAVAPQMLQKVAERLQSEHEIQQYIAAERVLNDQIKQLKGAVEAPDFWDDLNISLDDFGRQTLLARIGSILREALPDADVQQKDIILHVSDLDRATLQHWIDLSIHIIPRQFREAVERLDHLEASLQDVASALEKTPADEVLEPLVERLHELNQQLGAKRKQAHDLAESLNKLDYHHAQAETQLRKTREAIAQHSQFTQRVNLAARTQGLLDTYSVELTRQKLRLLENAVVNRFNELCHKDALIDGASIDPESFAITLYRADQPFDSNQFSAGESQLLSIALMWALRDISGLPMPIIIDTPLGRLDSAHRLSMLHNYFPRASHQVILLATDAEIDGQMQAELAPAISHQYHLHYDPKSGSTKVMCGELATLPQLQSEKASVP